MDKYPRYYVNIRYGLITNVTDFDGEYNIVMNTSNNKVDQTLINLPGLSIDKDDGELYYVKVMLMHDGDTLDSKGYRTIAGFFVEKNKNGTTRLTKWKEEKKVWNVYYKTSNLPNPRTIQPRQYTAYVDYPNAYDYDYDYNYNFGYAIFKGWYYDTEFKNRALKEDGLKEWQKVGNNDINFCAKLSGFANSNYVAQISNTSATATGVLSKTYITYSDVENIKIIKGLSGSDDWKVSEDGKKLYHPKYGTTDEYGYWGGYIELIEDEGGIAVTYNFEGEGKFTDAITGVGCVLSGTYKNEDGTDITLYTRVIWNGYVPVVK